MKNEIRALRSMRFSLFVYTVMVWGWGYLALTNIKGFPLVVSLLLPLLVSLPLLFLTLRFSMRLHGLTGPKLFVNSRMVWLYSIGVALSLVGYILAIVIAHSLHHPEFVIPVATLAVGLHFLFLALAFDEKRQYLTVAVFCITALLVPLTVPLRITIGSLVTTNNGGGWMVVTGIVGIIWLGLMALSLLVIGGRRLQEVKETNRQFEGTAQAG